MPNTSATGGYLTQTSASLEGQALRRFLQSVIVGVTGISASLVRPSWQENPPPIPAIDVDWCGFGIVAQRPEKGAYHEQLNDSATLLRHEQMEIMCAFYGPNCISYAGILRDGIELVAQNREQLFLNGMDVFGFSDVTHAPELVNDRYFDRADITMTINREVRRNYNIMHFVGANGSVIADDAASQPLINSFSTQ